MQPNRFTVIVKHPKCDSLVLTGQTLDAITSIALVAAPVQFVIAVPAQLQHPYQSAEEIEGQDHPCAVLATAREFGQGFDVEFIMETPWALEVTGALDYRALQARRKMRKALEDGALKADKARERARDVVLPVRGDHALFALEARAHLVGA